MAYNLSDSDEYEPSQALSPRKVPRKRTRRSQGDGKDVPAQVEAISRLFQKGGALDSQTTDSQFIDALLIEGEESANGKRSVAVQTDHVMQEDDKTEALDSNTVPYELYAELYDQLVELRNEAATCYETEKALRAAKKHAEEERWKYQQRWTEAVRKMNMK